MKKQKFLRGHRVKITDKLPSYMSHFIGGCEAIVVGSYSDKYGGSDVDSYALISNPDSRPSYHAWYEEDQLTLINNDRDEGEEILQHIKELS